MPIDWRSLSDDDVEQQYNPRKSVPDPQALLDGFAEASARVRDEIRGRYDLRYGDWRTDSSETFDLHLPYGTPSGALVVFIHGGFWRGLDKGDHTFVAPTFLDAGAVVANVNYDLCPGVTLDEIVEEIERAVIHCHANAAEWGADPARLCLVGHSAGAHLVAEMLINDWTRHGLPADLVHRAIALSGIYEPEVIVRISVNEEAQMTPDVAARHDCLARPPRGGARVLVAAGGDEPEGWVDQSRRYAGVCTAAGLATELMLVDGTNHFTVLENAATAGTPLNAAMLALIAD